MPLSFSGRTATTITGLSMQATGSKGENVSVRASSEALEDFGLARVQAAASEKYDAGHTAIEGDVVVVVVHTADCA